MPRPTSSVLVRGLARSSVPVFVPARSLRTNSSSRPRINSGVTGRLESEAPSGGDGPATLPTSGRRVDRAPQSPGPELIGSMSARAAQLFSLPGRYSQIRRAERVGHDPRRLSLLPVAIHAGDGGALARLPGVRSPAATDRPC